MFWHECRLDIYSEAYTEGSFDTLGIQYLLADYLAEDIIENEPELFQ